MSLGPDLPPIGRIPGITPDQTAAARRAVAKRADDEAWPIEDTRDVLAALGFIPTVPGGYQTPDGRWRTSNKNRHRRTE